jgi:predicted dehydrogenase
MAEKTVAVIGMGLLGSMHANKLKEHKNTRVIAVCDMMAEKASSWAEANGAAWYDSVEKLFSREKPDIVVVATQDPYHKEPLLAACAHKVPYIICEKPLTTTVEDALEVEKAAKDSGAEIKVLFPTRFYPLDQAVRLLLREGFLGQPSYGEVRLDDNISVPVNLWGKDSRKYASISNPAYFLLSHGVDILHFYFEPRKVKRVYAVGANSTIGSNPDYADGYLTFDDGLIIRLKTEWTKRIPYLVENYMQLTATKGGLTYNKTEGYRHQSGLQIFIDGQRENAEKAQARLAGYGITAKVTAFTDPITSCALELDPKDPGNDFDWGAASSYYADSFGDGKELELTPYTNLSGGIAQVKVVDAMLRSIREKREIEL